MTVRSKVEKNVYNVAQYMLRMARSRGSVGLKRVTPSFVTMYVSFKNDIILCLNSDEEMVDSSGVVAMKP